jgi:hypothetical protein
MVGKCVESAKESGQEQIRCRDFLPLVLGCVFDSINPEWVELAASAHLEMDESSGKTLPEDLAEVLVDNHVAQCVVRIRSMYVLGLLEKACVTLSTNVENCEALLKAVKAIKQSMVVTSHLVANDAALIVEKQQWMEPWIKVCSVLTSSGTHDERSMLAAVVASFPADVCQEPGPDDSVAVGSRILKHEKPSPRVLAREDVRSIMTLGEICQPPDTAVATYSEVMANMGEHSSKTNAKGAATQGVELPDLELSYANLFMFAHRLSALLYEALDTQPSVSAYDMVTVDIQATVFVSSVKLSGVGS